MEHAIENTKQTEHKGASTSRALNAGDSARSLHPLLQLQQQAGNYTVQDLLRRRLIQPKLAVSSPDDPEEQEADEVAAKVMRNAAGFPIGSTCSCGGDSDELCESCSKAGATIHRSVNGHGGKAPQRGPASGSADAGKAVSSVLHGESGRPLDASTRAFFEPRFGHDFNNVRVHTGSRAADSARAIGARAYAAGQHIVFDEPNYAPDSDDGRLLLAHELTHVIQNKEVIQRAPAIDANDTKVSPAPTQTASDDPSTAGELPLLAKAITAAQNAVAIIQLVRATLFPAYRRAVDALSPLAAIEFARNVVGSIEFAEKAKSEVLDISPDHDYHRFLVSTPGQPEPSEATIIQDFNRLEALKLPLLVDLPVFEIELAIKIGPQTFHDQPVLGSYVTPPVGKDIGAYLAGEAGSIVELLAVIDQIRGISGAKANSFRKLSDDEKDQIVELIEPWKGRPVNFAFLVRVLNEESIWQEISKIPGDSGKTLEDTNSVVLSQIGQTGALANVGELDTSSLKDLLGVGPAQQRAKEDRGMYDDEPSDAELEAMTDDSAADLFNKLGGAGPEARGPLIRQINDLGKLGEFCDHLPWKSVEAMHDAIAPFDPHAAGLLTPYYEDKGGGKSLSRMELDEVDENLSDEHQNYVMGIPVGKGPDYVNAFKWFFLDYASNVFTAGFHHKYSEAYDLNQEGWITNQQFESSAAKALAEAALITAASALTGGIGGEFGEGLASGLGATKSVPQIIGGATGGVTASLGGHLAGDTFEQLFEGKRGFDSFGSYAKDAALGGLTGTVVAGISVGAGRFLGGGQRPIDRLAESNPGQAGLLEKIRGAGFQAGAGIRGAGIRGARVIQMKVSSLLDLIHSGLGSSGALAYAGIDIGRLQALPPDTVVMASIRTDPGLTDSAQTRPLLTSSVRNDTANKSESSTPSKAGEPLLTIDKVEVAQPDAAAFDFAQTEPQTQSTLMPKNRRNITNEKIPVREDPVTPPRAKSLPKGELFAEDGGLTPQGLTQVRKISRYRNADINKANEAIKSDPSVLETIAKEYFRRKVNSGELSGKIVSGGNIRTYSEKLSAEIPLRPFDPGQPTIEFLDLPENARLKEILFERLKRLRSELDMPETELSDAEIEGQTWAAAERLRQKAAATLPESHQLRRASEDFVNMFSRSIGDLKPDAILWDPAKSKVTVIDPTHTVNTRFEVFHEFKTMLYQRIFETITGQPVEGIEFRSPREQRTLASPQ